MLVICALVIAYLIGSLSTAILLCRWMKLPDPRTQGSGNPGATNVLRFSGKKLALWVLFGDTIKGLVPVLLAKALSFSAVVVAGVGVAVFIGHLFPVFFRFRGGKGVATGWGVLLALSWPLGLAAGATWLTIFLLFRYSSLAALVTAALMPFYSVYFTHTESYVVMTTLMSALLCWRHRKNIHQLYAGTEKRFNR